MIVSISPEGKNNSHGENKKNSNYTKKNPPTIKNDMSSERSGQHLRVFERYQISEIKYTNKY